MEPNSPGLTGNSSWGRKRLATVDRPDRAESSFVGLECPRNGRWNPGLNPGFQHWLDLGKPGAPNGLMLVDPALGDDSRIFTIRLNRGQHRQLIFRSDREGLQEVEYCRIFGFKLS